MPVYFQKPENALKRANEFIDVGKKEAALDILYDVIKSKKHRIWQKIHEPILRKYLSLCVELKRSVNAKEGLYQYKLICQQVNIVSLEEVISYFLKLADDMAEQARNQSIEQVTVEDLDNVMTPEAILLSSVSSEGSQDRSDRVLLTPWVKFLWEAYRNVLELLRNNNRVERLYHDTAQAAFKFCLKYTRKAEFRKLCTLVKNHLDQVLKYQSQPTAVNLSQPESLQMNLETRLFQLDTAITMESWQEAFRAIEGIHYLMQLSKKPPKPHMMANYYEKVAMVFFKAGNHLFHAAALLKLFTLIKDQKKTVTTEELQKIGSKVLLATLATEIAPGLSPMEKYLNHNVVAHEKEKKLSALIGLYAVPTRKSLIKEMAVVIPYVPVELNDLYMNLEETFQPTTLCKKIDALLTAAKVTESEDHQHYVAPIQNISIVRMLKQVSQIYETLHFDKLMQMVPFADEFLMQRIIVENVKNRDLQVTIDHRLQSVKFGSALGVAMKEEVPEGPHVQPMPSEILRNQLMSLSTGLSAMLPLIQPDLIVREHQQQREQINQQYLRGERKEHTYILNRKATIETRKEKIESLKNAEEKAEREKINKQNEKMRVAEQDRLEQERDKREKERRAAEMKEIQKQQVWDRVSLLRGTDAGKKAFKNLTADEIEEMDPEDILQKQAEQLDREKRETQSKLKTQEKKVDYQIRAYRMEEIPKFEQSYAVQSVQDREIWDEEEKLRIANTQTDHQLAVQSKARLTIMQADKEGFLDKLFGDRHQEYQARVQDFEQHLEVVRQERLEERRKQRMMERRAKFIKERRAEKRKEQDEIERREQELERQRREKELEERRKQEEERRAAADRQLEIQRQREAEIEARMEQQRQEREAAPAQDDRPARQDDRSARQDDRSARQDDRSARQDDRSARPSSGAPPSVATPSEAPKPTGNRYIPPSQRQRMQQPDAAPSPDRRDAPPRGEDRRDGPPSRGGDDGPWRGGEGGGGGDGGGDRWKRGGDARDFGRRGEPRDGPPPRDFGDDSRGPPSRDFRRDDRGPPPRGDRDDRGPPPRDFGRRDEGRRDFDRRDDGGRDGGRDFGRRDDRGPDRRDDRGPDRRDDRGGERQAWGRGGGHGGGGQDGGGGDSWRGGEGGGRPEGGRPEGGRPEGRSWQASRARPSENRDGPRGSDGGAWNTGQ